MRSALVPIAQIGSGLSYPILLIGFLMGGSSGLPFGSLLMDVGILLLCGVVIFTIITLPVEWDASARAKKLMVSSGIITQQESVGAARVLNAAFLTYVASAVSSVMTLLYWLMVRGRR
jgi:Zn-dependent membrane protease YugP